MTLPVLTTSTWVVVHTAGTTERLQVLGGRVRLADNATPAANDYLVLPEGAVMDVTAAKWGQLIDARAYVQVSAV